MDRWSQKVEFRFSDAAVEKRASGEEVIEGVLVRYGDTADVAGMFRERLLPGALTYNDVVVNVQHDRAKPIARTGAGLELIATGTELRAVITPIGTRDGAEALALVKAGVLRGLSAEFKVIEEARAADGVREIAAGTLVGIGVVDRPAYPDSLASIAKRYAQVSRRRWAY